MTANVVSDKQIQANRHNARKSTGPKTPNGKTRVSRNAIKHGLLARQIVLQDDDPQENPADLDRLVDELRDHFAPEGPLERLLLERIAVCYWRLRRAYRFEAQAIHDHRTGAANPAAQIFRQMTGTESGPTTHALPTKSDLDKLLRYETMIDRELNRTMAQLFRLRHSHRPESPATEIPPPPVPNRGH
jgi:hypothetical protein